MNPLSTTNTITIFLGLGSSQKFQNMSSPEILEQACKELEKLGENFRVSSYIKSKPWGGVAQNIFVNAVCKLEIPTKKYPENSKKSGSQIEDFLDIIQNIENKFGRKRDNNYQHWADRTLDIDILYWGNLEISRPRLTIPHPYIWERDFVFMPLQEICTKEEFTVLQKIGK